MKHLLTLLFFLTTFNKNHDNGYEIDFKCYQGYVFDTNTKVQFLNGTEKRFVPTQKEIERTEKIIFERIPENKLAIFKQVNCPKIAKNLKKYNRQYIGYINSNGERIIWINFIWRKECPENWKKEIIINIDGCSYFWQVKINLRVDEIFDFYVNGVA
ncbi:hypothetical protein [Chryseobacterium chendengshani]|uniref:hypothetical protein n=1 Tax=unclassified Chryseobacterium TaxID=2593645 RepID=UPI001C642EAB|nr:MULTISPECIES: hypothetical protein [unclassified Chryseobacterium]MBW7676823.1 hypothetical protein [Chryseobacterium sp. LJ756]MBW8524761.1 hypothetical protein [Chryseobacterium sp. LJ668]QYK15218.1 hypothetical protein K0U91_09010 [Chryseobacterium sp. LJ668]